MTQPEPDEGLVEAMKPVAWMYERKHHGSDWCAFVSKVHPDTITRSAQEATRNIRPLYTRPSPAPPADVVGAAQFLCDRLDQQEWHDGNLAECVNDYIGHVDPAHERLKSALAKSLPTGDNT